MFSLTRLLFAIPFLLPTSQLAAAPDVARFFEAQCTECHDAETKKGNLDLGALKWQPEDHANFDRWIKIFDRVEHGEMPPEKKPRPEQAALSSFLKTLGGTLHDTNAKQQAASGRTVLRRLNRTEYENTVHDLLAVDVPLKHILPEETPTHGFDTVAEGLRFSQLQIEKYLEAADTALDAAIVLTTRPQPLKQRFNYKDEEGIRKNLDTPAGTITDKNNPKSGHRVMFRELPDAVIMFNTADYLVGLKKCRPPAAGMYRIKFCGYATQTDGRPLSIMVYGNDYREKRYLTNFDLPPDKPREFEFVTRLSAGEHLVINCDQIGNDRKGRNIYSNEDIKTFDGPGVAMQWVEVEGPLIESWPPPSVKLAFGDVPLNPLAEKANRWNNGKRQGFELAPTDPIGAFRSGLTQFATRAFRRPLEQGEIARFVKLSTDALAAGANFEGAMRVGLRAILASPQFLLFEERPGKLDDFGLASRLSYFLWSTMPDEELIRLATEKKLTQPETLRAQVERMLQSPKSQEFTKNFVGQWLDTRNIDSTMPDKKLYPEFDILLKLSMITETESFFNEVLSKNLPVSSFIDSDFAMINRRLANHYDIEGVEGEQFRRVSLPAGSPRGGVLTQASVLKVTANGTVTSPVLRGAWVLRRLLGQPPTPPPANVGSIEPDTRGSTTIREQLDKHRNSESCAGCHKNIDPPGFALESFDVIGGWRETYRSQDKGTSPKRKLNGQNIWQYKEGLPVDCTGELPDGRKFTGIVDFKKLLLERQDQVLNAVASKLLIYGTGAGIQFADRDAVNAIVAQTKAQGGGLRSLVHAVVESPVFISK